MEGLLGSKTAIKILSVLFSNPLQEFKEISLIKAANTGKGSASNLIDKLIKERVVISKRVGKTKIIKLNLLSEPVFLLKSSFDSKRLQNLPRDVLASIKLLKSKLREDISLIIAFGSYIAGTAAEESDIDILIVTKNAEKANEEKKKAEEIFGKKINLHIFTKNEIFKQKDYFIRNALIRGIIVYGYDMAFYLLKDSQKEPFDKIEYLLDRHKAALRNYVSKDYKAADYITENIIEQLAFLILSEKGMQYVSKKDAMDSIKKLPEGKIIENIKKTGGKQKIEQLEKFLIGLYTSHILGEYYA